MKSTISLITNWIKKLNHLEATKNKVLSELRINEYHELCQLQKKLIFEIGKELTKLKNQNETTNLEVTNLKNQLKLKIEVTLKNLSQGKLILSETKAIIDITKKKLIRQNYDNKGKINSGFKDLHFLSVEI